MLAAIAALRPVLNGVHVNVSGRGSVPGRFLSQHVC